MVCGIFCPLEDRLNEVCAEGMRNRNEWIVTLAFCLDLIYLYACESTTNEWDQIHYWLCSGPTLALYDLCGRGAAITKEVLGVPELRRMPHTRHPSPVPPEQWVSLSLHLSDYNSLSLVMTISWLCQIIRRSESTSSFLSPMPLDEGRVADKGTRSDICLVNQQLLLTTTQSRKSFVFCSMMVSS